MCMKYLPLVVSQKSINFHIEISFTNMIKTPMQKTKWKTCFSTRNYLTSPKMNIINDHHTSRVYYIEKNRTEIRFLFSTEKNQCRCISFYKYCSNVSLRCCMLVFSLQYNTYDVSSRFYCLSTKKFS